MLTDSPRVTAGGFSHLGNVPFLSEVHVRKFAANSFTDTVLDSLHTNKKCTLFWLALGHFRLNKEQLNVTAAAVARSDSEARTTRIHPGSYSVPTATLHRHSVAGPG